MRLSPHAMTLSMCLAGRRKKCWIIENKVNTQIKKFNKFFSKVSSNLYGEQYAISFELKRDKSNKKVYNFTTFNANLGSGKKQGEILCFDIAYILFAQSEKYHI